MSVQRVMKADAILRGKDSLIKDIWVETWMKLGYGPCNFLCSKNRINRDEELGDEIREEVGAQMM